MDVFTVAILLNLSTSQRSIKIKCLHVSERNAQDTCEMTSLSTDPLG